MSPLHLLTALATVVGCFTAITPALAVAAAIATMDWRVSGIRQPIAIRRSAFALLASFAWGLSLGALLVGSGWVGTTGTVGSFATWQAPRPGVLALTGVPIVFGLVPAGISMVLAWSPTSGTPDQQPSWRGAWRRWIEGRAEGSVDEP